MIGCVGALHTGGAQGLHIQVVEAHRHVRHHLELRAGSQQGGINALHARGQQAIHALQLGDQGFLIPGNIVLLVVAHLGMLLQEVQHLFRDGARHQNARTVHARAPLS